MNANPVLEFRVIHYFLSESTGTTNKQYYQMVILIILHYLTCRAEPLSRPQPEMVQVSLGWNCWVDQGTQTARTAGLSSMHLSERFISSSFTKAMSLA